jgi:hypothetical protein
VAHAAFWMEMLKGAPPAVYLAKRTRALAPAGFGLNRGPTARLRAALDRSAASSESGLLAKFAEALRTMIGRDEFIIACDVSGRERGAIGNTVGPVATTLPLVCRLPTRGSTSLPAKRIARDLQLIKAHAAFDMAACEEAFAIDWRANDVVPSQFGYRCMKEAACPVLLTSVPTPRRFGTLIAYPGAEANVIENDIQLTNWLDNEAAWAELAYDRDAVEDEFAESLFATFLDGKAVAGKQ